MGIRAEEIRINNYIGVKTSNDAGIYQVAGINGWQRIFKTPLDKEIYEKPLDRKFNPKEKQPEYTDERLVRIMGGGRNDELFIESKLKPIKATPELLVKLGLVKDAKNDFYTIPSYFRNVNYRIYYKDAKWHIEGVTSFKYIHHFQNIYYFNTNGKELFFK
jgi:hypothetical protein